MSAGNELPSASHIQAAQTLEMVSQQAVVHQDGQVLIESAVADNSDVTMVTQPQHVVDMHNYVSTASETMIHMSGGAVLAHQGQTLISQAGGIQVPHPPMPTNVTPVTLPLMQQVQLGNQTSENVNVIKMLQQQQQQMRLLEKSRVKQQQMKQQQQQQQTLQQVDPNLLRSIQHVQVQGKLQPQHVQIETADENHLHRVQMQNASLRQQLTQPVLDIQQSNLEAINQPQLQHETVQDHQNSALHVHSVVSLKDNMIATSPFLQLQDPKTGQQVVIETSVSDNNETALQLQFLPDSQSASKGKQVVLPADAPPPPVLEDEELVERQPTFQEPVGVAYDDRLLWCHDCGAGVKMVCRQHGEMTKVKDRLIPSRAKLTAPHHVAIKVIELRAGGKNVYGVFARKVIQKRTVFGPYEGLLMNTWDYKGNSRLMLKIFSGDGQSQYVDCVDQEHCNWMIFARPARSVNEQNLVAYQYKGSIYFASTKVIAPGSELKVWYAQNYGAAMGAHDLPLSVSDESSELASMHLNESDFDGLELPMECDNEDVDYQPPSAIAKEIQEQVRQATESEVQAQEEKYTCPMCREEFRFVEEYEKHDCGVQKTYKRKIQPVKIKKRMIKVLPSSSKQRSEVNTGMKALGVSTRSSRRGTRNETPTELEDKDNEKQDGGNTMDVQDSDMDEDNDQEDDSQNNINGLVIVPTHKKGPGRPKGSKSKVGGFKGSRGARKKFMKPKALFACTECDKAFTSLTKLKSHQFQHSGEKPFICKFNCGKAFSSKFKQIRHELIHAGEKRHCCPYCQKTFSRKDHMKNHLRIHDPNKELFKCGKCGKEYASPFAYKTHIAIHAADEGDMTCGVCKEEFQEKDKLMAHLKVHAGARSIKDSGEKTQKCQFCDKLFFTKKDVKRHLVVHTKDRDFLCQFCPQRFGRRDHLVRHLNKAHPGEGGMPPASPPPDCQPETPTPKKSRTRNTGQRQQGSMLSASTMSELLQSVTRNAVLDTNIQPGQEVREIEVQLIRAKDSSGQDVMIPVSQAGMLTNMVGVNYGGNLQGVYQGGNREVTAVLSQPISEPIMSGHFVPPTYMPQQGEEEDNANRQQQNQPTLSTILNSDPRFAVASLAQTQPQQVQQNLAAHPILTYGTLPGVGFSSDPSQPQKIMLTSMPSADLGDQQIQIQQGNMVFTMKASALLDQYAQQTQAAPIDQTQHSQ